MNAVWTRLCAALFLIVLPGLPAVSHAQNPKSSAPPRAAQAPATPQKWIGVQTGPLLPGMRSHLKKQLTSLPDDAGMMVYQVMPESPATVAGLEKYDIVLRADGQPLTSAGKLQEVLNRRNFGTSVRLDVLHEGQPKTVYTLVLERPEGESSPALGGSFASGSVMVLSSDGKGAGVSAGNAKVNQRLIYTDVNGQRHELTGDQIAEFHKRMREDENFRKTVKEQQTRMEVRVEGVSSGTAGAGTVTGSSGASVITIQTSTPPNP